MTDVRARKLFPETAQSSQRLCHLLLSGAARRLLFAERLGLDRIDYCDCFGSHSNLEDQKALQRYAFLASFFVNGGFRYETTR